MPVYVLVSVDKDAIHLIREVPLTEKKKVLSTKKPYEQLLKVVSIEQARKDFKAHNEYVTPTPTTIPPPPTYTATSKIEHTWPWDEISTQHKATIKKLFDKGDILNIMKLHKKHSWSHHSYCCDSWQTVVNDTITKAVKNGEL